MTVYLVGAGPGDPGLLTVRGAELLRTCDVIVHDRLSGNEMLDLAPAHAERINVGKAPGNAPIPQPRINALLVEHGLAGRRVVRLKGGDPFVFARGGEEAMALAAAGVPFECVPGISSALAAPAAAGVPLTLRHEVFSFTVVTGHQAPGTTNPVDWRAIAAAGGTIVILMAAARIGLIADELVAGGLDPATPVAAVRWATTDRQEVARSTLADIADVGIEAPATFIVGMVAALDIADPTLSALHIFDPPPPGGTS
ncbi:MAG: uroporphyrinogen-III C-methyltransferase [Acidimicrobiales bacterium]